MERLWRARLCPGGGRGRGWLCPEVLGQSPGERAGGGEGISRPRAPPLPPRDGALEPSWVGLRLAGGGGQPACRAGASPQPGLPRATSNTRVRETVALELSYVNSSLQLLKEELEELNCSVDGEGPGRCVHVCDHTHGDVGMVCDPGRHLCGVRGCARVCLRERCVLCSRNGRGGLRGLRAWTQCFWF